MLAFIRRALSSWVVLLLLGFLVVAFVVTGVRDPFGGGGPAAGSLAKVGNKNITEVAFSQEFERFMKRAREQNPSMTNAEAARQGGVEQILDQMVRAAALEEFGRKQGIAISTRVVDGQIASVPAFQSGGKFDETAFRRMLAENRITEKELREGLTGDAIRGQLLQNIAIGTHVPQAVVDPYSALLLETRQGSVAVIPANADVGKPTDAQLDAFYKSHIAMFTTPERKGFRYALLTPEIAMAGVTIKDDEIKRYYDEHQETYGGIEQRELLQAVVPDQATADKIVARVKGGEGFEKVAGELAKLTAADLAVGQTTEAKFAQSTSPAVAKAAFAAPANGVTAPVKSDFGWHVVQVKKVIASPKRSLDSVKAEINAKLREERAQDVLSDAVAAVQDAFDGGKSFSDVAKEHKLTIVDVPPITRTGRTPEQTFTLDPKLQPLLGQVFDAENGGQPSVQEVEKGKTFALLEIGDTVPAAPVPLAKIREAVSTVWAAAEKTARAKATAEAIVADVAKGKTLAAAAADHKVGTPQTVTMRRLDIGRVKVTPPMAALFTLAEGGSRAIPVQGAGFVVVHVDKVTPGKPAENPSIGQATRAQMATSMPDEIVRQFVRSIETDVGVKIDPAAVARVRARYLGEASGQAQ